MLTTKSEQTVKLFRLSSLLFRYVYVVAICRGKIFIINPRFRVMPHAYEIYIEKETETSFSGTFAHTDSHTSVLVVHTTCFIYPTTLSPVHSHNVYYMCGRRSLSQKMWIKLFFFSHTHSHTYKERHSWDESEIWYARCCSNKKKLSEHVFFSTCTTKSSSTMMIPIPCTYTFLWMGTRKYRFMDMSFFQVLPRERSIFNSDRIIVIEKL